MDRPTPALGVACFVVLSLAACAAAGTEEPSHYGDAPYPEEEFPFELPDADELPDLPGTDTEWPGGTPADAGMWAYTEPGDLPTIRDAKGMPLPLIHTAVKADLRGHVADVTVAQTFRNDATVPIEVVYAFPLPENAAVSEMRILIGERVVHSVIKTRAAARETYEQAREAGHTSALLEQERPNIFTQSLANLPPKEEIDVEVHYVQSLTYDAGRYEFVFPMVVGPRFVHGTEPDVAKIRPPVVGKGMRRGDDFTIEVTAKTGHPISRWFVPTHDVKAEVDGDTLKVALERAEQLPNRDFVLRYSAAGKSPRATMFLDDAADGTGHYLLVVQPPELDVDRLVGRREFIFVVDQSGSMSGPPLALAKEAVRAALAGLRPVDTFNVVGFESGTHRLFDHPRPANDANLDRALMFLAGLRAGGGTEMKSAVEAALADDVEQGRHRYVLFLTDGYIGFEEEIFAAAAALVGKIVGRGQIARVFAVGIGASPNRHLLDGLAKAGRGLPMYVSLREHTAPLVGALNRYVDKAVVEDLTIDSGGLRLSGQHPARPGDLFASHAAVVVGEYRGTSTEPPRVRGKVDGKEIEIPVSVVRSSEKDAVLDALWARAAVADLEPELWSGPKPDVEKQITRLGLEHHIVTAFTSLVAVDESRVVSDGKPRQVVEPTLIPEGVDPGMAGASMYGTDDAALVTLIGHTSSEAAYRVDGASVNDPSFGSSAIVRDFRDDGRTSWPPRARLLIGDADVPDGTKARPFKQVIREARHHLRRCYEKSDEFSRSGRYRLTLELTTRAGTRVVRLRAPGLDADVRTCMESVLKAQHWPKVTGLVTIPLRLSGT